MKKFIKVLFVLSVLLTFRSINSFADETVGGGSGADFGVSAIYPDNQIGGQLGYYNLRVTPGTEQEIKFVIKNYSENPITVQVEKNRATTGDGGLTEYKKLDKAKDKSMLVDFEEIATLAENEFIIAANGEQQVSVQLKIPEEEFKGQVLGGIHIKQKDSEKKDSDKMIVNKFSYSMAVLITESDEVVKNDLDLISAEPGQRNHRNFIEAELQNRAATMVKNLSITESILNKGTGKLIYEGNTEELRMAPNSSFSYGSDLEKEAIVAGDYLYTMDVLADGEVYHFTKEFKISAEQEKKLNSQSVYLAESSNNIFLIIGVIVSCLVILFSIIYYVLRIRKKNN